jgi:hypothetical protein
MTPNLLFHPVSDKRKAFARIAYGKVVHPAAKDRFDLFDHSPTGWLMFCGKISLRFANNAVLFFSLGA